MAHFCGSYKGAGQAGSISEREWDWDNHSLSNCDTQTEGIRESWTAGGKLSACGRDCSNRA